MGVELWIYKLWQVLVQVMIGWCCGIYVWCPGVNVLINWLVDHKIEHFISHLVVLSTMLVLLEGLRFFFLSWYFPQFMSVYKTIYREAQRKPTISREIVTGQCVCNTYTFRFLLTIYVGLTPLWLLHVLQVGVPLKDSAATACAVALVTAAQVQNSSVASGEGSRG